MLTTFVHFSSFISTAEPLIGLSVDLNELIAKVPDYWQVFVLGMILWEFLRRFIYRLPVRIISYIHQKWTKLNDDKREREKLKREKDKAQREYLALSAALGTISPDFVTSTVLTTLALPLFRSWQKKKLDKQTQQVKSS